MIRLTDYNGQALYLAKDHIKVVITPGPSSSRTRAIIKTQDGKTLEVLEDPERVIKLMEKDA